MGFETKHNKLLLKYYIFIIIQYYLLCYLNVSIVQNIFIYN